ncbi:hypothetical protein M422DRAFT_28265, partial [Sphaerobolus stellatus SS14]
RRKAALNAFKSALDVVGKSSVPFIGIAVTFTLRIIKGMEETGQVTSAWDQLSNRVERLSALLIELNKSEHLKELSTNDAIQSHFQALNSVLENLAQSISEALEDRSHKFLAFWNTSDDVSSADGYRKRLDSLVVDMTLVICGEIGLRRSVLEKNIDALIQELYENPTADVLLMDNNLFRDIRGDAQILGQNIGSTTAKNNTFEKISGKVKIGVGNRL